MYNTSILYQGIQDFKLGKFASKKLGSFFFLFGEELSGCLSWSFPRWKMLVLTERSVIHSSLLAQTISNAVVRQLL